jgi:tetratricopeptide (TPR) repeat protein
VGEDTADEDARYWAFISYSHKDAAFGRRLHRRLEHYVVPRRLVGRMTIQGPAPPRLVPIFRDREELPAANDLSAEVRAALQKSRNLIVVCSPAAASSPWVSREVELFRALHPDRAVLAAVLEGEPSTCFPAALLRAGDDGNAIEPLAADFRARHDGERLGLLKLVAGIIGIGLDELVQRDAQRNLHRVTAVTAIALAAMLIMGVLAGFALNARTEAERQRNAAEGLVEFMLTDLRDKLKGVGRLDVMTAVDERALHYYSDQNLDRLPAGSLERRARIFHAMGEDDEIRGDHNAALAKFHEAKRVTATLLAAAPNDQERIFDYAQSEYWLGYVDYQRGQLTAAASSFRTYKQLADRLVALAPENPAYRREVGYAETDLCSLALEKPENPDAAIGHCTAALQQTELAARGLKASNGIPGDLANLHAWLADAYDDKGNFNRAWRERMIEQHILDALIAGDPKNLDLKDTWIVLQRALAKIERQTGHPSAAETRLEAALIQVDDMLRQDPANNEWKKMRSRISDDLQTMRRNPVFIGEKK